MIAILPTDKRFYDSPDAGGQNCLCSRCGKAINEEEVPIRLFSELGDYEYRYHSMCVGFETLKQEHISDSHPIGDKRCGKN